jgi:oligoribonuclease NrnB/cAMP/cGMP phosphodiesterase (DHH superfamily)
MNKVLDRTLITHTDLDGIGCAIVFSKCFPGTKCHFVSYREADKVVRDIIKDNDHTQITMSDMSISDRELLESLNTRGNFELIDHHFTAKWLSDKYEWALVDTSKSATMLMYEVMKTRFNIEDLLPLVELVNDYDTWGGGTKPGDKAKELNRLLGIYGLERFFKRFLAKPSTKLDKTEALLLELEEEKIDKLVKLAVKSASVSTDAVGNKYAMIVTDRYISESCHAVLAYYKEIEYVMSINFIANEVSLRGRGNINLGEMARAVDGGGHRQSAGFQIRHGSQLRMVLACQGSCPVTERLEKVIKEIENGKERP